MHTSPDRGSYGQVICAAQLVILVCEVTLVLRWSYEVKALSIGLQCRAMRCDHSPPLREYTVLVRISSVCACARRQCVVWSYFVFRPCQYILRIIRY